MRKFNFQFILTLLIVNISYSQYWNEYVKNDWNRVKTEINTKTFLVSGSWLIGMYLLSFSDEYLNHNVKQLNKGDLKYYFKVVDKLGYAPMVFSTSIGVAGLSFVTNDSKFRGAALTSVESILVTSALVYALKIGIGRKRPFEKKGAHFFEPFSGWDDSFPSGHTSTAFALITPWIYYYKKPWTYFLFIFPASTALSRMIYDKHWTTDVITGGFIGYVIGYSLTNWHKDFKKSQNTKDMPPMISLSIPL
jgi:membrane-associated phospholipid phosphatase